MLRNSGQTFHRICLRAETLIARVFQDEMTRFASEASHDREYITKYWSHHSIETKNITWPMHKTSLALILPIDFHTKSVYYYRKLIKFRGTHSRCHVNVSTFNVKKKEEGDVMTERVKLGNTFFGGQCTSRHEVREFTYLELERN